MRKPALIFTCEHAGNAIPSEYRSAFRDAKAVLQSHRGLDIGAFVLGKSLARIMDAPLHASTTSRLLVDLNRSLTNSTVFSEYSERLTDEQRNEIVVHYYLPYRRDLEKRLRRLKRFKTHVSVHSFTPVLNGKKRRCDIGLLFDPKRSSELDLAHHLREHLAPELPGWKIHFNQPYKGTGDGITTDMRKIFRASEYAGIEIEVRQDHLEKMIASKKLGSFAKKMAGAIEKSVFALEARRPNRD